MSGRALGRIRPLDILAESLEGLHLIEASAGTGKTHTLADLYLRLVLEGGRPVDQILVVTFTVAATAELRDRIRARLEAARGAFERGVLANPRDGVLAGLLARIPERAAATRRLAQAVQGFDEAAILTIHGFCQRVLKEGAFESGQPFEAELVPDEGEILQEVVDDFWRKRLYRGSRLLVGYLLRRGWKPGGARQERAAVPAEDVAYRPTPNAAGRSSEAEALYETHYREARGLWDDGPGGDRDAALQPDLAERLQVPGEIPPGVAGRDRCLPAAGRGARRLVCPRREGHGRGAAVRRQEGVRPAGPPVLRGLRAVDGGLAVAGGVPRVPGQDAQAGPPRLLPARVGRAEGAPAAHRVPGSLAAPGPRAQGPARRAAGRGPAPALLRGADRRVPGHRSRPVLDLQADLRRKPAPGLPGGGSQAGHLRLPGCGHLRLSGGGPRRGGEANAGSELALRPRAGPRR